VNFENQVLTTQLDDENLKITACPALVNFKQKRLKTAGKSVLWLPILHNTNLKTGLIEIN